LNLEYCIIYELETCDEIDMKDRESYWINKLHSVNKLKLQYNHLEYRKEKYNKTKDALEYYHKNKLIINQKRKEKYKINKHGNEQTEVQ